MTTKKRSGAAGALARAALLALLAGCGGGTDDIPGTGQPSGAPSSKGNFTAFVTFGDSLSDVGTYAPATSLAGNGTAPYFGGKFTANSATAKIWVENLATTLSLVVTPAEVGFGTTSVKCPAAASPALASTCTAYGQGGSRVTDPNGIGHTTGTGAAAALTVPVKTQIANHLARFTSFKATDLIVIWAGNNDAFAQFSAFSVKATAIQTDAAMGRISADEANRRLFTAQTDAQYAMKAAAQELVGYIKDQILAKGGKYVAVMTLPDSTLTPFGGTLPASAKPVLSGLVDTFNLWLRDGLTGQPVKIIDQNAPGKDVYANPAKYGLVNNTVPTCDATKISNITGGAVTDGSSLFCNSTPGAPYNGIRTGADVNTWQFADAVHPTPGGHKIISDYVTQQLHAFGWI
jgi:phospholipase/lecithinase/hemolysin